MSDFPVLNEAYFRERAVQVLAEYDFRFGQQLTDLDFPLKAQFYAEMTGLLSEALRGWIEATK